MVKTLISANPNPTEPDGLVVEGPHGVRLLAVPTTMLEILRFAETIQYTHNGTTHRMRVANLPAPEPEAAEEREAPALPPGLADPNAWKCLASDCGFWNLPSARKCFGCGCPKPSAPGCS